MGLYNLVRMTTSTTGSGTITLGAAIAGCLSFSQAGVLNGEVVSYGISDGANSEVGRGTYTSAGTTLARTTVLASTNGGNPISLSGNAHVYITALAQDFPPASTAESGAVSSSTSGAVGTSGSFARADHNHDLGTHAHTDATVGGQLDHGTALTGLGDDDHTQYLLANGTRALNGDLLVASGAVIGNGGANNPGAGEIWFQQQSATPGGTGSVIKLVNNGDVLYLVYSNGTAVALGGSGADVLQVQVFS